MQPHKEPSHELYCNYREGHKAPQNQQKEAQRKRALLSTPLINKDEKKQLLLLRLILSSTDLPTNTTL